MEINIINSTIGVKAKEPVERTEFDFWQEYLYLLNFKENLIARKEAKILAWVLSHEPDTCYFSVPHKYDLIDDLDMSESELTQIKQSLLKKGFIEEFKVPEDKRRKKAYPIKALTGLRDYIRKSNKLTIVFPYGITKE